MRCISQERKAALLFQLKKFPNYQNLLYMKLLVSYTVHDETNTFQGLKLPPDST